MENIDITWLDPEQKEQVKKLVQKLKDDNIKTLNALAKGKITRLTSVQRSLLPHSSAFDLFDGVKWVSSYNTCKWLWLGSSFGVSIALLMNRLNTKLKKVELNKKVIATAINIFNRLFEENILEKPDWRPH